MSKEVRALLEEINSLKQEVRDLYEAGKDEEANKKMDEIEKAQAKFENLVKLEDDQIAPKDKKPISDPVHDFAEAARHGFRNSANEGTGADGGYTVPEDIQTRVNAFRDASFSMRDLVSVEKVTTMSGARTYKTKAQNAAFAAIAEGGAVGQGQDIQFTRVTYAIKKYGGYFPVTNELLADSDANIARLIAQWIGDGARATDNALVFAQLNAKEYTGGGSQDINAIKTAINVTLGQAYRPFVTIVTNDNGLNMLDSLKDADKRYLLTPDISTPGQMRFSCGADSFPIRVVPNAILSNDITEVFVGDGTTKSWTITNTQTVAPTVKVNGVADATATVSGKTVTVTTAPAAGAKVEIIYTAGAPFFIGDFQSAVKIFDREQTSILASNVAATTNFNAFENDMTLFRALLREDVKTVDAGAFVHLRASALASA